MASFPSVRIEGGLLGPDLLDQLLAAEMPGQKAADFGLDGRRNLTDEIAAAFADARAQWGIFQNRLERLPETDLATTATRDSWVVPLLGLLGYEPQLNRKAFEVDGLTFAVSHRAGEADDAAPVHIVGFRQKLGLVPPSGRPRLAPHSLVQEYLNRTEQVWGLVTNGQTLRLLRDSTFVRRQAYVEFDLQAIIEEQRFADFAVLYRLLHRTRLPRGVDGADDCLLEHYYTRSIEQGGRVREHLRDGVEACIQRLADGFLRHAANDELRRRVSRNAADHERIAAEDFYRQLLRLVYRLLFLLVSEDRGLLSKDPLYHEHYGIARLRRLLDQRAARTEHEDLWQSLRVLWRVLTDDRLAAVLKLAPLNGELFAPQDLDTCTITNRDLLDAFWHLAWYQDRSAPPRRVNYAALDVEELGSVYESLLEFHPAVEPDSAGRPTFALIAGSERKATGSYYTPPPLVAELIKSALEPVIADRLAGAPQDGREKALLSIRVCDPACGSGHFLLAAARRIGKALAQVRTGEDEPSPERVREATRDVIAHCIYGVDKNPLAVDLCRVALWLESHTEDRPLTFLDHRIRCGDALVGVTDLEALKAGIPDGAYAAIEGDDKVAARAFASQNRSERGGQRDLFAWEPERALAEFTRTSLALAEIDDDTPEAIRRKKQLFEQSHAETAWQRQREACDLWTAAFFQPFTRDALVITSATLAEHLAGRPSPRHSALALDLASRYRFFHWSLEFPEVFADGGFDVVFGNPPWETLSPDAKEFFGIYDPRVRFLSPEDQKAAYERLLEDPAIAERWNASCRDLYAQVRFFKQAGRYRLFAPGNLGKGDFNVYRMFLETALTLARPGGFASQIVPENLYNGANAAAIRAELFQHFRLDRLIGFENTRGVWFPSVDTRAKFCLYVAAKGASTLEFVAAFRVNSLGRLAEAGAGRVLRIPTTLVHEFSPDALAVMEFAAQEDIDICRKMYGRYPRFGDEIEGLPYRSYMAEVHMGNNRDLFTEDRRGLPVFEGRMVDAYDYRAKGYISGRGRKAVWVDLPFGSAAKAIQPQWRIPPESVPSKLVGRIDRYRIGFCNISSPTNSRSMMATLIPINSICGDSVTTIKFDNYPIIFTLFWLGIANSLCMDYLVRKKISLHLTFNIVDSLPFPRNIDLLNCRHSILQHVISLCSVGHEMEGLSDGLRRDGVDQCPDGTEDVQIRARLMAEIDALVAREVYGLTRNELLYILDPDNLLGPDCGVETFKALRNAEIRDFGEYRTQRLVLEAWDRLERGAFANPQASGSSSAPEAARADLSPETRS